MEWERAILIQQERNHCLYCNEGTVRHLNASSIGMLHPLNALLITALRRKPGRRQSAELPLQFNSGIWKIIGWKYSGDFWVNSCGLEAENQNYWWREGSCFCCLDNSLSHPMWNLSKGCSAIFNHCSTPFSHLEHGDHRAVMKPKSRWSVHTVPCTLRGHATIVVPMVSIKMKMSGWWWWPWWQI